MPAVSVRDLARTQPPNVLPQPTDFAVGPTLICKRGTTGHVPTIHPAQNQDHTMR